MIDNNKILISQIKAIDAILKNILHFFKPSKNSSSKYLPKVDSAFLGFVKLNVTPNASYIPNMTSWRFK